LVETFHALFIILLSLFFFAGLFRGARESPRFWPGFFGMVFWLYLAFDVYSFANLFLTNVFFAVLGVFFMAYTLIGTLIGLAMAGNYGWRGRASRDEDLERRERELRRIQRRAENMVEAQRRAVARLTGEDTRSGDPVSQTRARVWDEIERMRNNRRNDERDALDDLR